MSVPVTVELCLASRELGEPRCSSDGEWVAFTTSWAARKAIVVVPVSGGPERPLTTDPEPRPGRGGCFDWLPDGTGIVYVAADGDLWLQPVPGGPPRRLTAFGPELGVQAPAVAPDGRSVAVVVELEELWVVPLDGSAPRRVGETGDFVTDPAWAPDGRLAWHEWSVPAMAWDESRCVVDAAGSRSFHGAADHQAQQPRFSADGTLWSLRDDRGWLNVYRGDEPFSAEPFEHGRPTWGPGQRSYAVSPDGTQVVFARNELGFGRLCIASGAGSVRTLGRGEHAAIGWVGNVITAIRSGAVTPPQLVAYDVASGDRRVLAEAAPLGWRAVGLTEPVAVTWAGDDGGQVHGRLYRPGTEPAKGLLCWMHGGPTDQWTVSFMPRLAYWVAQGWNVLVPDFRGSTGHGRDYQQAMRERWGELDVADVVAGLRHAHSSGWGAPDTTIVLGGSAGGFTALHVVARAPECCVGAVVSYPVSDLIALDETTHRFEAHYNASLVGPRPATDARYRARSPIEFAAELRRPLLVMHGDTDPVIGVEQSRELVRRVVEAGGEAELVVYEGEGHGFRKPANQLDEYRRIADFIARILA